MEMKKVIDWNLDQLKHVELVQRLVLQFAMRMLQSTLNHDRSKFDTKEYEGFLGVNATLKKSKDGKDADYQKSLKQECIQHHVKGNPHHPEFWDNLGKEMPFDEAVIMYFDWMSRNIQGGKAFADFLEYNLKKLEKHPTALAVVKTLMDIFPESLCKDLLMRETLSAHNKKY